MEQEEQVLHAVQQCCFVQFEVEVPVEGLRWLEQVRHQRSLEPSPQSNFAEHPLHKGRQNRERLARDPMHKEDIST